jgi:hypothetical protein
MLQAYIDASAKGDPRLLVLAGFIACAEVWAQFSIEWKKRLDQANLDHFKMYEMQGRPEIVGYFCKTLEEFDIDAFISCVIRTDEMREVIRSTNWPRQLIVDKNFENSYFFGFKAITNILAQKQHELGLYEPVDLIFDEDGEASRLKVEDAWTLLKVAAPPEVRKLMGDEPSWRNDKKVPPLQAADLFAWWVRKFSLEGIVPNDEGFPLPWKLKRKIPGLHMEFGREAFRHEFEKMLHPGNLAASIKRANSNPRATLREIERRETGIKMTLIHDPSSPWGWRA